MHDKEVMMNTTFHAHSIRFALATLALAGASATVHAAPDNPQLRDGSTGVMQIATGSERPAVRQGEVQRLSRGETSTFVNGRPNAQPDAPMAMSPDMELQTRAMGAPPARAMAHGPYRAQMGGTPD
jgi:hypothetical protein